MEFCPPLAGPGPSVQRGAASQKECSFFSLGDCTLHWNLAKLWLASSPRINFNGHFHSTVLDRNVYGFPAEKQKQRCHKEVLRRGTSVWLCNRRKTCWSLLPKILSVFLWHWYLRFPSGKPPFSNFHVIFEIKWISYTGHKNAMCGPDYLCHLILSLSPYSILLAITWFWDGPCPKAGPPEPRRLRTSVWVLRKADFPNCWTDMRCRKCGASLMFCAELRTKPVLKKQNQERDPYNIIWALNQVILRED